MSSINNLNYLVHVLSKVDTPQTAEAAMKSIASSLHKVALTCSQAVCLLNTCFSQSVLANMRKASGAPSQTFIHLMKVLSMLLGCYPRECSPMTVKHLPVLFSLVSRKVEYHYLFMAMKRIDQYVSIDEHLEYFLQTDILKSKMLLKKGNPPEKRISLAKDFVQLLLSRQYRLSRSLMGFAVRHLGRDYNAYLLLKAQIDHYQDEAFAVAVVGAFQNQEIALTPVSMNALQSALEYLLQLAASVAVTDAFIGRVANQMRCDDAQSRTQAAYCFMLLLEFGPPGDGESVRLLNEVIREDLQYCSKYKDYANNLGRLSQFVAR